MNLKTVLASLIGVGIIMMCIGVYLISRPNEVQTVQQTPSSTPYKNEPPKNATPKNELIENAAYKYDDNARVYIHKSGTLYVVATEEAFLRHYGCSRVTNLTQCSPIYTMPKWVTSNMISSEWIR